MTKEQRDLQVFGYGLGIIAAIFGFGGWWKHGFTLASAVLLACCLIFVAATALNWQALRPGYAGWMKVAHCIGMVVTTVILAVVFFALFTPVAMIIKLFGKDHLARKWDRAAPSYWLPRLPEELAKERYLQQF